MLGKPNKVRGRFEIRDVERPRITPDIKLPSRCSAISSTKLQTAEQMPELLEYEWPDLPPILDIRKAMSRTKISRGVGYILPVDKGRNSIQNSFRTDMRALFHEPYVSDKYTYNEETVSASTKKHFHMYSAKTKWERRNVDDIPVDLNSESERFRLLYLRSARAGSLCMNPNKWSHRTRSSEPLKCVVPEDSARMRKEAEKILQSAQRTDNTKGNITMPDKRIEIGTTDNTLIRQYHKENSNRINNYAEVKSIAKAKRFIPEWLCSQYLTKSHNQYIWTWLHNGEFMSEFEYFLTVCG